MVEELVEEELIETENEVYKCPGCGANLAYNTETKSLHCQYCGYELLLKGVESAEEFDFFSGVQNEILNKESRKAECHNCGATVLIESEMITCNCPFCDTPMALSTDELYGLKPNRVIPFTISKEEGIKNYQKWLKKKFFAPRKIKKEIPNPNLYSVYIPSWTFDTNVFASYEGKLGKRYTTYVGSGKNRHAVTRIRWFRVSGLHQKIVDDVLVCSGKQISQNEIIKLEPFSTNEAYVYDNRYIVGHTTEHYSIDLNEGWKIGQARILETIKHEILRKYNHDVVSYLNIKPNYTDIKYKYVIIPIWICHYSYGKRKYKFLVNGETGKIFGKAPISAIKVSIVTVLAIAFMILMIYLFVGY